MKKIVKRLRLYFLKIFIKSFQSIIKILNFNSSLLITKNSYIYEDGILLNIDYTNRYLKSSKKINEGNVLIAKLEILGLKKSTLLLMQVLTMVNIHFLLLINIQMQK